MTDYKSSFTDHYAVADLLSDERCVLSINDASSINPRLPLPQVHGCAGRRERLSTNSALNAANAMPMKAEV